MSIQQLPKVQDQEGDATFMTLEPKDAISQSCQYLNQTDVTVAPPETAAQEPPTAVRPDNARQKTKQSFVIRKISVRNIEGPAGCGLMCGG